MNRIFMHGAQAFVHWPTWVDIHIVGGALCRCGTHAIITFLFLSFVERTGLFILMVMLACMYLSAKTTMANLT
jgi:hypothetical protein